MLCSYCIVSLNGCFLVLPWWHIARNLMRRKRPDCSAPGVEVMPGMSLRLQVQLKPVSNAHKSGRA